MPLGFAAHSGGIKEYGRKPEAFDRLAGALDYIFDSDPERTFKVDIGVVEED